MLLAGPVPQQLGNIVWAMIIFLITQAQQNQVTQCQGIIRRDIDFQQCTDNLSGRIVIDHIEATDQIVPIVALGILCQCNRNPRPTLWLFAP